MTSEIQDRRDRTDIRRKLAALFAADVAGYTRLMAKDEEDTTRRLVEHRAVMESLIEHHGGRIANTAGDSVLAEFESSVDAVRCAIEVQEALRTKNDGLPENRWLQFRIGVNVGDVIKQGGDLLGDGVNIAARLESIAQPGGICISEDVRNQIEGKLTLECVSLGKQRLKNLRHPVLAYRVTGSEAARVKKASVLDPQRIQKMQPVLVGLSLLIILVSVGWLIWNQLYSSNVGPFFSAGPALASKPSQAEIDAFAKSSISTRDVVKKEAFGGHEYALVRTWGVKWIEAEAEARAMGGYLVAIGSEKENNFVVNMIREENSVWRKVDDGDRWQRFGPWIGLVQRELTDEPLGGWVWSNGEELSYTNWFWHQPDNYDGIEHFGRFRQFSDQPGLQWDDAREVSTAKGYIVEFE